MIVSNSYITIFGNNKINASNENPSFKAILDLYSWEGE